MTLNGEEESIQYADQGVPHPAAHDGGGIQDSAALHDRQEEQGRVKGRKTISQNMYLLIKNTVERSARKETVTSIF